MKFFVFTHGVKGSEIIEITQDSKKDEEQPIVQFIEIINSMYMTCRLNGTSENRQAWLLGIVSEIEQTLTNNTHAGEIEELRDNYETYKKDEDAINALGTIHIYSKNNQYQPHPDSLRQLLLPSQAASPTARAAAEFKYDSNESTVQKSAATKINWFTRLSIFCCEAIDQDEDQELTSKTRYQLLNG